MRTRRVVRAVWPVVAAAGLGSVATVGGVRSRWYRKLEQPSIQPPPAVFRWVWTGLYSAVAAAAVVVDCRGSAVRGEPDGVPVDEGGVDGVPTGARKPNIAPASGRDLAAGPANWFHRALLRNMALNAGWTWIFFRGHSTRGGLVAAAFLAADSVGLTRRAARSSCLAGSLVAPYAAWTCFAVVLNGAVIARNPSDRSPWEERLGLHLDKYLKSTAR